MNRRTLLGAASLMPLALALQPRSYGKPIPPPEPKVPAEPERISSAVVQIHSPFIMLFQWAPLDKWPRECPPARLHAQMEIDVYKSGNYRDFCVYYSPAAERRRDEPDYVLIPLGATSKVIAESVNAFGLQYAGSSPEEGAHIFLRTPETDRILAEGKNALLYTLDVEDTEKASDTELMRGMRNAGFVTDYPLRPADPVYMEEIHQRRKERHGRERPT